MRLPEYTTEVRLFLFAYAETPLSGTNGVLDYKTLPMWALVWMGTIEGSGHEALLGINRRPGFVAPFVSQEEDTYASTGMNFLPLLTGQPTRVEKAVAKVLKRTKPPTFTSRLEKSSNQQDLDILRGAVLLNLEDARMVTFAVGEGFGIFLRNRDLRRIREAQVRRHQKESIERTVSIRGVKMRSWILKMPVLNIGPTHLNADLAGDEGDIGFMIEALTGFEEASREVRLQAWKKCGETVIG